MGAYVLSNTNIKIGSHCNSMVTTGKEDIRKQKKNVFSSMI